ncbi:hypothetical protein CYMTET_55033, partial [Cymbomonas tetramitiformis]
MTKTVGKKELLQWASETSGLSITRFEDLKDGGVLLKLFAKTWPLAVDVRLKSKSKASTGNWDIIKGVFLDLGLPMQVYAPKGIQASKFKACYSLLVMVYFLFHLATKHDFSVDFAHPIDPKLAAYLQSSECIDALARGGALQVHQAQQLQMSGAFSPPVQAYPAPGRGGSPGSPVGPGSPPRNPASPGYMPPRSAVLPGSYLEDKALSSSKGLVTITPNDHLVPGADPVHERRQVDFTSAAAEGKPATRPGGGPGPAPAMPGKAVMGGYSGMLERQRQEEQAARMQHHEGRRAAGQDSGRRREMAKRSASTERMRGMGASTQAQPAWVQPHRAPKPVPEPAPEPPARSRSEAVQMHRQLARGKAAVREKRPEAEPAPVPAPAPAEEQTSTRKQVAFSTEGPPAARPEPPLGEPPGPKPAAAARELQWRDEFMQQRGEVLLANMRFEVESYKRQHEAARQERDFVVGRYNQELAETEMLHESELVMQRETLKNEMITNELRFSAERSRDQQGYIQELQKLAGKIEAEVHQLQRGNETLLGTEERDELAKLRQLQLVSTQKLSALQLKLHAAEEQAAKLEAALYAQQSTNQELSQRLEVHTQWNDHPRGGPGGSAEDRQPDTPDADKLLRELRRLKTEAEETRLRHARELEEARHEAGMGSYRGAADREGADLDGQSDAFQATLRDFDEEQRLKQLEADMERLQKENTFLKRRAVLFDERNGELGRPPWAVMQQMNGGGGMVGSSSLAKATEESAEAGTAEPPYWLPSEQVEQGDSTDSDSSTLLQLLDRLKARLREACSQSGAHRGQPDGGAASEEDQLMRRTEALFWKIVMAHTLLKQRTVQSRAELISLHATLTEAQAKHKQQQGEWAEWAETTVARHKKEIQKLETESMRERTLLGLKVSLGSDALRDLKADLDDTRGGAAAMRQQAAVSHEERFKKLLTGMNSAREECTKLRLRETHWAQLVDVHLKGGACGDGVWVLAWEGAQLEELQGQLVERAPGSTEHELLLKEKSALKQEAAAQQEAIAAVDQMLEGTSKGPLDVTAIVDEATAMLRAQLVESQEVCEDLRMQLSRRSEEMQ